MDACECSTEIQTDYPDVDKEVAVNFLPLPEETRPEDAEMDFLNIARRKRSAMWTCDSETQTQFPLRPVDHSAQTWLMVRSIRLQTKDAFLQHRASVFYEQSGPLVDVSKIHRSLRN